MAATDARIPGLRALSTVLLTLLGVAAGAEARADETLVVPMHAYEVQHLILPARVQNQLSIALVQDFGLGTGADVCSRQSQLESGYACFRHGGSQYHGTPEPGRGGEVGSVLQPATARFLVGYDRVVLENLTFGVRVGYVLHGGGPRESGADGASFLPFHGELRAGYTFGASPFRLAGLRWSLFVTGGVAQVDTEHRVFIREDQSVPPPTSQLDNPPTQTLSAYKRAGTGFVGGGAAVTWAVTRATGFTLGLRVTRFFPSAGTAFSPEIGWNLGF
ncbi:hypothetical protein [Chondromyces crocatus]|uniref:Outer membrane protein beta-barrel domain-containing protein n=1 Tax=Chondromyces crocatus TaxID=52 RepID=A0A0K1EMP2_CHOCO|nr:hypothetical protein [Chondromyces crocatus]AKT42076.1 uncharacterized protein CMC5_062990 [Chondromyces crocatus]